MRVLTNSYGKDKEHTDCLANIETSTTISIFANALKIIYLPLMLRQHYQIQQYEIFGIIVSRLNNDLNNVCMRE